MDVVSPERAAAEGDQVIHGLKILVTGAELQEHLRDKARHHASKAEKYGKQVEGISELQEDDASAFQSNDPRQGLKNSAQIHANKAALFTFMADHLIVTANYMLDEQDLMRVEIMERGW